MNDENEQRLDRLVAACTGKSAYGMEDKRCIDIDPSLRRDHIAEAIDVFDSIVFPGIGT